MKTRLLIYLSSLCLFFLPSVIFGQALNLGTASSFAAFTAVGAFNNTGATIVTGDIGTNVGEFTGFPTGVVIGQVHVADVVSATAAKDVALAYSDLASRTCGSVISTTLGSGQILTPGVYCLGAASTLNKNLILDAGGNPNGIFIFKINGALSTTTLSSVTLINSASACNVFWQVNGQVQLGAGSTFVGTILANGAISLLEATRLTGRALSQAGAISLHNNIVNIVMSPIASTITASGATTFCAPGSVVLSGNACGTWSTGATTPTITVTTPGDYFVTNTNACGSVTSNHIIVKLSQPPVVSTITANGVTTFCAPGSVVLSGNEGGTWSTGATTASITVTTPGDYYVTNTNACGSLTSNHIIVKFNQPPVAAIITTNGPTEFCGCGSIILTGNGCGTWNTGATTESITVTTSGDYYVTCTNSCGSTTSNHIIVTVSQSPVAAIITANGPTEFCGCGSVVLSGNGCGTWNTGATTESITVTTSGDYYVTCTNSCGNATSNHIIVKMNQQPVASIITSKGPIEFCGPGSVVLIGNVGGTWSNGAITGSLSVTTPGDYYVTNTNACGCVTSNHIIVKTATSVPSVSAENTENVVSIYPNPSSTSINIDLIDFTKNEKVDFKLYNAVGVYLMNGTLIEKVTNVKTGNFDSGFYFYRVIKQGNVIQSGKLLFKSK